LCYKHQNALKQWKGNRKSEYSNMKSHGMPGIVYRNFFAVLERLI